MLQRVTTRITQFHYNHVMLYFEYEEVLQSELEADEEVTGNALRT